MDSLQIKTGVVNLRILDDEGNERGIFKFNPEDIESAKRVIELQDKLVASEEAFAERCKDCKTAEEQLSLLTETIDYYKGIIDECFGEGTSQLVFGDAHTLSMFGDFIEGITPYYKKASEKRTAKYRKQPAKE